jgi:hypothetical protein
VRAGNADNTLKEQPSNMRAYDSAVALRLPEIYPSFLIDSE